MDGGLKLQPVRIEENTMEIKQLKLENLGQFRLLDIDFAPTPSIPSSVTVFIGNNGAGKTSILRALATSLSWFVSRIRSEKSAGNPILEDQILNGTNSSAISVTVMDQREFRWTLAKTRAGRKGDHISQLQDATQLADRYRSSLTSDASTAFPVIAFYPVERSVLDIPLKIKEKHSFLQLDGYDNSLNQGVDFRRFFEWFREREDVENEVYRASMFKHLEKLAALANGSEHELEKMDTLDGLKDELRKAEKVLNLMQSLQEHQLDAVRTAIESFMPGFSNLRVQRQPRPHMSIEKNGETLNVAQLSQGEKSLMALVGDIARRLAMMNPKLENPLLGKGVVLIDEVDMHLHPQWARTLIERLTNTFPHCQFILSTHSPLVISDYKDALVYSLDHGQLTQVPPLYGQDANTVLLDVMDTDIRNAAVAKKLNDLLDFIQDQKLADAKALLSELENELPSQNLELAKAKLMLRKEELRLAKN